MQEMIARGTWTSAVNPRVKGVHSKKLEGGSTGLMLSETLNFDI